MSGEDLAPGRTRESAKFGARVAAALGVACPRAAA